MEAFPYFQFCLSAVVVDNNQIDKGKSVLIVLIMFWHNHAVIWKMKLIQMIWFNLLATV